MKLFYLLCFFVYSGIINAQQTDTLTNEKVIKLFKAGFTKEVLNSKIKTSTTKFDVSIDGMVTLKKAGVPEETITLMILNPNSTNSTNLGASEKQETKNAEIVNLVSGIYYKKSAKDYLEVEPSVLTSTKSDNAAQYFISPLVNSKLKASLSGKRSTFQIYETSPTFLFIFDTTTRANLNNDNSTWFSNARSPKEFLLVILKVGKNSREITIGKANAVGSDMGIDDKFVSQLNIKKLSTGVYEVKPEQDLLEGEYCFMFAQGIRKGGSNKVFDFSILKQKAF